VLAVRVLAAKTSWLAGRLRWNEGRVAWERAAGLVVPGAAEIAAAERDLREVARSPGASARALGDVEGWLARRHERLRLAKALGAVASADLSALAREARAGGAIAVAGLADALAAEALCIDVPPVSPSRTLVACGTRAARPLAAVARDLTAAPPVRALAALALGAIARTSPFRLRLEMADAIARRAVAFSLAHGLPSEPPRGAEWDDLLSHSPELAPLACDYVRARRLLGGDDCIPAGVRRALGVPSKVAREFEHLREMIAREPGCAPLVARVASLDARLADREALERAARRDAGERLARLAIDAIIESAERQALDCYRARLEEVVGRVPADLRFDEDLLNAILLSIEIMANRRLLLDLLRARAWGDRTWRERQPANVAFLERLAAAGAFASAWQEPLARRYACAGAVGGSVRISLETDPLSVLQMGNYFNTCLGVDGCNAFSVVANACDRNKRVAYARDGAGRPVGRKLIAVDESGKLVGFYTYVSLHDDASNDALYDAFDDYVAHVAAACRLALADDGVVPCLVAEDWYDDGAVVWTGRARRAQECERAEPPRRSSRSSAWRAASRSPSATVASSRSGLV
jgi:hypothetical protein